MRVKVLTICASILAAAGLSAIPAFASASTLTLQNVLAEPAQTASFNTDGGTWMWSGGSYWTCEDGLDVEALVTANETDPVTLESASAGSFGPCTPSISYKKYFTDVETTEPMTLNADGTGELPIEMTMDYQTIGLKCQLSGTLDLDWTQPPNPWLESPVVSYEGTLKGCLNHLVGGTFEVRDDFNEYAAFSVTP